MAATATRERARKPDSPPIDTTIRLWSPYSGGTYLLRNDVYSHSADGSKRLVEKGWRIKFVRGLATIPEEWLAAVLEAPWFTGETQPQTVWFLEDAKGFPTTDNGPHVISGPMSAHRTHKQDPPPVPGWQTMTPQEIAGVIHGGHVPDLMEATVWEAKHRGNEIVLRMLATALAGESVAGTDAELVLTATSLDSDAVTPGEIPADQRVV